MAKITYKGEVHEVKVTRGILLRMEREGFPVSDADNLLKTRPLEFCATAVKLALGTEDDVEDILESYPEIEDLTKAAIAIISEVTPTHPTRAAKPRAARKR